MSDKFESLDANEKAALLYRCRALVGRIGEELRKKKPEHFVDEKSLATQTGRPSDAPIPLCLCKTPACTIPHSGSIAGRNGSRLFVALAMDRFKSDWENRERCRLTKWSHARSAAMAKSRFIATILLPFGSSLRLSNYRRRVESAPRLPSELR
jgi:hypothetical protein